MKKWYEQKNENLDYYEEMVVEKWMNKRPRNQHDACVVSEWD